MKYDLKNTLSENQSSVKSLITEKEIYSYNFNSTTATFENAVQLDTAFSYSISDLKKIIIDFSCKIPKTDYINLIQIMMNLADKQGVYPMSDSFYAAERGTKRSISQWLIETYLQVDISSRINSKTLSKEKSHYYGYFIRVPIGRKTETRYRTVVYNTATSAGPGQQITREEPYQVQVTERQAFGNFNDPRYQDYIKKLEKNQDAILPTDITAIPNDWKPKVKKLFGKDVNLDCYSICNEGTTTSNKKTEKTVSGCPFKSSNEELKFRKWVKKYYPNISTELDLDETVPASGFCNDFVMKAVNYVVKDKKIPPTSLSET